MRLRPVILARLWLRFVVHCVIAGIGTARIILRRETPPAGLVRLRYAPMSATGAAILGAMVTLSPGTSAIDIDPARREILLHLLDRRAAGATLAGIRRNFEPDLCRLFPEDT
jgi:multicomponent K+:H+ antiporter subunit E/multicomponent Na+:H+ antiporter subunit E